MPFDNFCLPTFAGHQTFHPRFGWLKKGFDAVCTDERIFTREDATTFLGVGKNMVDAIRFWCLAAGLIEPHATVKNAHQPTDFGSMLISNETGFDPYIEDPTTLWLIHLEMVRPQSLLPVWWIALNEFEAVEFTTDAFQASVVQTVRNSSIKQPNETSILKDVDAFIRMYGRKEITGRQTIEDQLDSPFRDLGMLTPAGAKGEKLRFVIGEKANLSATAVAVACLDYIAASDRTANSISLGRLASDPNTPGHTMKLTVESIRAYLEAVEHDKFQVTNSAGSYQLFLSDSASNIKQALLETYYSKARY